MTSYLGNSESFPYPTTITREDFQSISNVDDFLYENHRFSAIDSLIKDLTNLSTSLNQELLDLVNSDYQDFIKLGKSINGSLGNINSIKVDLKNFNHDLSFVNSNIDTSSKIVQHAINHKKKLIQLKTRAKLLLLLNDQISNFEYLLSLETDNIVFKLKNLTSMYLSFSKLGSIVEEASVIEKDISTRILTLNFEFKAYLEEILRKKDIDSDLVIELLNIYKIIGHEKDLIAILKREK